MCLLLLKQIVFLTLFVNLAWADCNFHIIGEAIIEKTLGYHKILIPKANSFALYEGERANAYCETSFRKDGSRAILSDHIKVYCEKSYRYYAEENDTEWTYLSNSLICDRASEIDLYESAQKMFKCEEHSSLAIGVPVANSSIYAAFCYDWYTRELKYVNYIAYKRNNTITPLTLPENEINIKTVSMDKKIISYQNTFSFMSQDQFTGGYAKLKQKLTILENVQFEYANLVQDIPLADVFEKYDDIFNIIWWRNLRAINWRNFMDKLEERSKSVKYDVKIGTSTKILGIPSLTKDCNANESFTIVTENNIKKSAPLYIWAHVKAVSGNSSDDFVVIGFNSPFIYFKGLTTTITESLCVDICDTIDWMHSLSPVRLMPAMGVLVCCRPSEVYDKLDNFPWSSEEVTTEKVSAQEMEMTNTVSDVYESDLNESDE